MIGCPRQFDRHFRERHPNSLPSVCTCTVHLYHVVYFKKRGRTIVVLLAGGDKRTQSRDIETALRLARNL